MLKRGDCLVIFSHPGFHWLHLPGGSSMFFSGLDSMKAVCSRCVIQSGSVSWDDTEDMCSVRSCIVSVCVYVPLLYVCSCMCACVCAHGYTHMYLCVCMEARGQCQVSVNHSSPYFSRQHLSLNQELIGLGRLAGQWATGTCLLLHVHSGITWSHLDFYVGCISKDSGPCPYIHGYFQFRAFQTSYVSPFPVAVTAYRRLGKIYLLILEAWKSWSLAAVHGKAFLSMGDWSEGVTRWERVTASEGIPVEGRHIVRGLLVVMEQENT